MARARVPFASSPCQPRIADVSRNVSSIQLFPKLTKFDHNTRTTTNIDHAHTRCSKQRVVNGQSSTASTTLRPHRAITSCGSNQSRRAIERLSGSHQSDTSVNAFQAPCDCCQSVSRPTARVCRVCGVAQRPVTAIVLRYQSSPRKCRPFSAANTLACQCSQCAQGRTAAEPVLQCAISRPLTRWYLRKHTRTNSE